MSEKRLIDANALKQQFRVNGKTLQSVICAEIDTAPTVAAEPVRHGRWEERTFFNGCTPDRDLFCSCCNHDNGWSLWKYCPYCGAKMDAEEEPQ